MIADLAVILAAGGSFRMGAPKARLPWEGGTLLEAHVRQLAQRSRTVAVAWGAEDLRDLEIDVRWIRCEGWRTEGMFDSLRAVLHAFPKVTSAWVTPVDVPPAPLFVLDAIAGERSAVPSHHGQAGHPVLLGCAELTQARERVFDGGLRELLALAPKVEVGWESVHVDFDDPNSWESFRAHGLQH